MKRGKDEEKKLMMGPLFPRLHVKDTEKGGMRAPPRNKMALYEQLSVPSNRFNPTILPLKQNTNNHITPPPSSTQVSGSDRTSFTPLHLPPTQAFFPEKSNPSESTSRVNAITSLPQVDRRTIGLEDEYVVPTFTNSQKIRTNDPKHSLLDSRSQILTELKNIVSSSNIQEKTTDESSKKNEENCLRDNERVVPRRNFLVSEEQSGHVQLKDERSSSDASIVDSASAMEISPDEVVAVIGPKLFWKARRVIVNQQRLFAMQVFELHRLIKVQKLIAENPHLLFEDGSAMIKPPLKSYNAEKPAPGSCIPKFPTAMNPTQPVECSAENAVGKPLLPTNKITPPGPPPEPWPGQTQPAPQGPHQWLVPVMSPTEGLIYKPCLGPTGFSGAPIAGFGPYGSPSPVMGNFTNPVYGVPAHPQHSYFPTYGIMPMLPVPIPGRAPEQAGCFPEPVGHASIEEIPRAPLDLRIPKEFDSQGSTPNSPIEKAEGIKGGGTFKLFPDGGEEQQVVAPSRVIKAVPHNARTASESVARIIRSIQEERNRQLENL